MKRLLFVFALILAPAPASAELTGKTWYHIEGAAESIASAMAITYFTPRSNADEVQEIQAVGATLHRTMQQLGASPEQFEAVQQIIDDHKSRLKNIPDSITSIDGTLYSATWEIKEALKHALEAQ